MFKLITSTGMVVVVDDMVNTKTFVKVVLVLIIIEVGIIEIILLLRVTIILRMLNF